MPELPEVETIKRGLEKNIIGKQIADFYCDWPKMINYSLKEYKAKIKGLKIQAINRRAKMLILNLSQSWNILIHLKMTGQLVYGSKTKCLVGGHPIKDGYDCLPNKFTHATFTFSDQSHLYFNDVRKFGWLRLFTDQGLEQELDSLNLGPEPLTNDFSFDYFKNKLKQKQNSKIKQFLMEPKNIVGIGNIYSDEVCFYAKVKPTRLVKNLKPKEIELLYKGIKKILQDSIKLQGTTFSNYRNAEGETGEFMKKLKVYGRAGEKCKICNAEIKKIKIGGRTASFCPKCQK
ncbi:MAG: DNA-formamidopyrimidine glycosylase [Candidatus Buchananbacteria bacterium]|nr:DNA-formamidopyrimidine glycosylase [Candidatus Buchananbacteria bacterium]